MTDEEIAKNNEIIAEFMGYIYSKKVLLDLSDCGGLYEWYIIYSQVPIEIEDGNYLKDEWWKNNRNKFRINLEYNYDWNELITVVEKISNINGYNLDYTLHSLYPYWNSIDHVYEGVITFITNYNTQKND